MAKVTLGGTEYNVPELNFMALERAWPYVEASMVLGGDDPMAGPLAALRIIAAGFMEDENFDPERFKVTAGPDDPDTVHDQVVAFLRKKMKAREIVSLPATIMDIMSEAGLGAEQSGEVDPVGETASPSPETALAS